MAAIIIPAHNESAVIRSTLVALIPQLTMCDQVVVVCNGCTDDTADLAREFEPHVAVLETSVASKVHALNLGDMHAEGYPRIYMDADIVLAPEALQKIITALQEGGLLAVSPMPVMQLAAASWAVRAYYDIWLSLPYCQSGMVGAGVYGLSETGRKRFDQFPDVIADDGYVRALFQEHERGCVVGAQALVMAPASLSWLLKIKARSRLGQMDFARKFPELIKNERKDYLAAFMSVLRNPLSWPKLVIYLYVNFISRRLAKQRLQNVAEYRWEKDLSSRELKKESSNG